MRVEIAADPPSPRPAGGARVRAVPRASGTGSPGQAGAPEIDAAVAAAEAVMAKRFGARIRLADAEDLGGSGRSAVLRVKVAETPFALPRTLVVKRYLQPEGAAPRDSWVREAVSYQLFTALAAEERMCPELFAHDSGSTLLVMEDLGRAPTLAEKLHGEDSRAAEAALLSWARSLGKLHASTAGREADFDALLRRLRPPKDKDPLAVSGPAAVRALPALLAAELGVRTSPAAEEAAHAALALLDPGRLRAFSPSDSCPDNNLITNRGVRFLDFEGGCVRNMMFDAAYLTVPFPSCWCAYTLPRGMTEAMLAAWRAEVRVMWPDLDDDAVLLPKLLDAQLFWVWLTTHQFLTVPDARDLTSGGHLPRPDPADILLSRWADLARAANTAGADATAHHAVEVVAALTNHLGRRDLPLYPAFQHH